MTKASPAHGATEVTATVPANAAAARGAARQQPAVRQSAGISTAHGCAAQRAGHPGLPGFNRPGRGMSARTSRNPVAAE